MPNRPRAVECFQISLAGLASTKLFYDCYRFMCLLVDSAGTWRLQGVGGLLGFRVSGSRKIAQVGSSEGQSASMCVLWMLEGLIRCNDGIGANDSSDERRETTEEKLMNTFESDEKLNLCLLVGCCWTSGGIITCWCLSLLEWKCETAC